MQEIGNDHAQQDDFSFRYIGKITNDSGIPLHVRNLVIADDVEYLPNGFCVNRQQLSQVVFPSRLILIGNNAFTYCTALTHVALPSHLISIGQFAFSFCYSLMTVSLPEGLQRIGKFSFANCPELQRIHVPSTVEKIEDWAFCSCFFLVQVTLSEGLVNIGKGAFRDCFSLREMELPQTVEEIGESGFQACRSLRDIVFPSSCQLFPNVFAECFSLVTIKLPSTTTVIGNGAFRGCSSLEEVCLGEGLMEICTFSFLECVSLNRIKIPSTVKLIGRMAFHSCVNLISMEFPPSMQGPLRIDERAVENCDSLVNFALPSESEVIIDPLQNVMAQIGLEMGIDVSEALYERFDGDPIHKKCYHSCQTTLDGLRQELEDRGQDTSGVERRILQPDLFDMTPFHVLLSAPSCRHDLLKLLLQHYPSYALDWKDILGRRAIDYLSSNRNQEARAMMESYLQRWWIERLAGCGINGWRSDMTQRAIVVVLEEDRARRDSAIGDAYRRMKGYEKSERMSLLELALWKNAMDRFASGSQAVSDREVHRANSGATFVVPHVIAYLENCFENNDAERWFCPSSSLG